MDAQIYYHGGKLMHVVEFDIKDVKPLVVDETEKTFQVMHVRIASVGRVVSLQFEILDVTSDDLLSVGHDCCFSFSWLRFIHCSLVRRQRLWVQSHMWGVWQMSSSSIRM